MELFYENETPKVRIDYTLTETNATECNFVSDATQAQYSLFSDGPWSNMTISGTTSGADSSPIGTAHTASFEPLYWEAVGVANGDYYVRLQTHNGTNYGNYAVSPFTVTIYNPTMDDFMRHGKFFFEEKLYFFNW